MNTTHTELPQPSAAGGRYTPVIVHNGIAYVSGQLPRVDGQLQYPGKVGKNIDLHTAQAAARLCAAQCLAALDKALGGLARVEQLLKVTGYVASGEGFNDQPLVIDAASEYFQEKLGARGTHARSAIGVFELPRGACVEVELVAAIRT